MAPRIPDGLKHTLLGLVNRPYVAHELAEAARPIIVHVSDTPRLSYPFIYRVARLLRPEYLIHTGDVVDDIKLENRPHELPGYRHELKRFLARLERAPIGRIYLVPGNHDDPSLLEEYGARSITVAEGSNVAAADLRIAVSHKYDDGIEGGDFYLFGHTPWPGHHEKGEMKCLNGISHVTVIEAPTRRLHMLPYPMGTDNVRKVLLPKPGL